MNGKIFVLVALLLSLTIAAAPSVSHAHTTTGYFGTYMLYSLPISTNVVGIATAAVLVVLGATGIIYMLAKVANIQRVKAWATSQIYEALLSLVMLLIFISLISVLFLDPQPAYSSLGLMPSSCQTSSNIFELSVCDITTFNNNALFLTKVSFILGYITGLSPGAEAAWTPINYGNPLSPISVKLEVSTTLTSIIPITSFVAVGTYIGALLFAIALSDVQSIMLGASLLFLSFFITIGLVSRIFGFSRSFGGLMVAFGLGLGIVYPLLVTITYGFIVNNMMSPSTMLELIPNIGSALLSMLTLQSTTVVVFESSLAAQGILNGFVLLLKEIGYTVVGLTIIPLMNFVLLETFITDFSAAVGEKMSFMVLLGGLI